MTYSLQRLLIILGIVVIPFYEIFIKMLPFVASISPDSRVNKEIISLVFALSIGLLAVWQGNIKPFRNRFLLIIPVYLLLNLIMSPHAPLIVNNVDAGDFYFWKPFSEVLCFSLMIFAVSSADIDINEILKIMVICGAVMSGYVILQRLGLDQFWTIRSGEEFVQVHGRAMGGNLGQPTIVSSWIIMMIPLAMYLRKWWMVILMVVACILTEGAVVISALGGIWIISVFYRYPQLRNIILIFTVSLLLFIGIYKPIQNKIINRTDGRWRVWGEILNDIHDGQIPNDKNKYSITGVGFGRFPVLFPIKNKSLFQQAHNDILEFIYNCGLIGGFLLLAGIFIMIMFVCKNLNTLSFSILLSFISVFLCSLGSFPFQLGAHQFYSSILVGLLNNEKILGRIKC